MALLGTCGYGLERGKESCVLLGDGINCCHTFDRKVRLLDGIAGDALLWSG